MTAAPRARVQRRPVHGVLLLDKPLGLSSNQALQKAKWLLAAEKAGHTGTLDPLATGVLPLCFGAATKFSQLQLDADKTYTTTLVLGTTTSTGDGEGDVTSQQPVTCSVGQVVETLDQFMGLIEQVPPMYSALKHEGQPLYALARQGKEVERQTRQVTIHELELLDMQLQATPATLTLKVTCSKGTYIRTLAEDIGKALGCGAYVHTLRRVATGTLTEAQCISLEALEATPAEQRTGLLQAPDSLLGSHMPIELASPEAGKFLSGQRVKGVWPNATQVRVYGTQPRALLGIGHIQSGELISDRLLSPLEIQHILEAQA